MSAVIDASVVCRWFVAEHGSLPAIDFLDRWDFDAYIEEYRRGKDHSRREELASRQAPPRSAPPSAPRAPA